MTKGKHLQVLSSRQRAHRPLSRGQLPTELLPTFDHVLKVLGKPGRHERPTNRRAAVGEPRRLRRLADATLTFLLIGALGLVLFVAYGLVDNRWYHVLAVQGGSMAPTILPGDAIVITRPPDTLEPGMVLVMEIDGVIVTHRLVKSDGNSNLVTKGDANASVDDWSNNGVKVAGLYRFRLPAIGKMLQLATD